MLPKAIIVDLDDTLFDSRCMKKYFPTDEKSREQWDLFQIHIGECTINSHIAELIQRYMHDYYILFVTSREARNQHVTTTLTQIKKELAINFIHSNLEYQIIKSFCNIHDHIHLFMRTENDYRPSEEVKRDIYFMCIKDRYDVSFAIDDCPKNIAMWQSLGINTLQCAYGNNK